MQKSQLDASTYGVGELITQRKVFVVPEHQRNFSWSSEEVDQYLSDISQAWEHNASDYFIGLIVLQGPTENGAWEILDGQQRLATTTMIYSAIREWLINRDYKEDAQQIENEFIGVRQLGGSYKPRLRLNTDNREIFDRFVVNNAARKEFERELKVTPKRSSNYSLLDAALGARQWLENFCVSRGEEREQQAQALFSLASYIEKRVSAVCVDVTSETDAYILFESLNDRGMDLSALDLVKNHIFRFTTEKNIGLFRNNWELVIENIEGKDADDFLKVFWTSRFGIVQKLDLFKRIRESYPNEEGAQSLVEQLADASEKLEAIDDPEHELWQDYGAVARDRIRQLITLGSRQVRPVILAALSRFTPAETRSLLWGLVVLIVRYQLVGRGRTGILEQFLGRIARGIWHQYLISASEVFEEMAVILPDDQSFQTAFALHAERKASRISYLLSKLESTSRYQLGAELKDLRVLWGNLERIASPETIVPLSLDSEGREIKIHRYLGNYVLLEHHFVDKSHYQLDVPIKILQVYGQSNIVLTAMSPDFFTFSNPLEEAIIARSKRLAELATETWSISSPLEAEDI